MQKKIQISRKIEGKETEFEVSIPLLVFMEDKVHIVYAPALDLSGYGESAKEAMTSFELVLEEFFDYTSSHKTLLTELERLGWKHVGSDQPNLTPPTITEMAKLNEDFDSIFEVRHPTVAYRNVRIPSYV